MTQRQIRAGDERARAQAISQGESLLGGRTRRIQVGRAAARVECCKGQEHFDLPRALPGARVIAA